MGKRVLVAGLALVVGVGAAYWWLTRTEPAPPPVSIVEAPPPPAPAPPPEVSMAEGEALLKSLLGGLSPEKEWAAWLAELDLIRRVTAAVQLVSEGQSPRPVLGFLGPAGDYEVVTTGKKKAQKTTASPKSYARYDRVTVVLTSVDAAMVGAAYGKLKPWAEAAYAGISKPGSSFDAALRGAISRINSTPVPEQEPELREEGLVYKYVDPQLEALSPAQKHLLRMGPKNARAIQKWLGELERAIPLAG